MEQIHVKMPWVLTVAVREPGATLLLLINGSDAKSPGPMQQWLSDGNLGACDLVNYCTKALLFVIVIVLFIYSYFGLLSVCERRIHCLALFFDSSGSSDGSDGERDLDALFIRSSLPPPR